MIVSDALGLASGVYSIREATLYIKATVQPRPQFPRLNAQHLHWWAREGLGREKSSEEVGADFVNFLELVSFRMVAAMRAYGISGKDIQIAHRLLQERWRWQYPFAMEQLWVATPNIFVELSGAPVAVNKNWQAALAFMNDYLIPVEHGIHGLTFDAHKQAANWQPSAGVLLDPLKQFGEPCIEGTRVPTETIWAFHRAGDSIGALAAAYGLPAQKIEAAIAWEEKLEQLRSSQGD